MGPGGSSSRLARPRLGGRVDTDLREVLNAIRYIARSGGLAHAAKRFSAPANRLPVVPPLRPEFHVRDDPGCGC